MVATSLIDFNTHMHCFNGHFPFRFNTSVHQLYLLHILIICPSMVPYLQPHYTVAQTLFSFRYIPQTFSESRYLS